MLTRPHSWMIPLYLVSCSGAESVRVRIAPEDPTTEDRLVATVVSSDLEGPYRLRWFEDGRRTDHTGRRVGAQHTRRDARWEVAVFAEGEELARSRAVTIRNTPPEAPQVQVQPESPWIGAGLECAVVVPSSDVDGDTPDYAWEWLRDGAHYGASSTVPPGVTEVGEEWTCVARASDGTDFSEAGRQSVLITDSPGGNVLLVLVDDAGIDKIGVYGEHDQPARTPVIDALAEEGMLFRNAYARSVCTPARAALMTGRHGRRYGLGDIIHVQDGTVELPLAETLLPEVVAGSSTHNYATAAAGKWHLSGISLTSWEHPVLAGWDWYGGSLGNLMLAAVDDGIPNGYYHWEKSVNGEAFFTDRYATSDTVDDAIALVETLPSPWLIYVAFNAPHVPTHVPPAELLAVPVDENSPRKDKFDAALEAADTELGRLFGAIPPDTWATTTVILLGDNGTPGNMMRDPLDPKRAKRTLYEGGVNVPMIVTSPLLHGTGESDALVDVTDVFMTVAAITGGLVEAPVDGISLLNLLQDPAASGQRDHIIVDLFTENGAPPYDTDEWMIRDLAYKLMRFTDGDELFFDMRGLDVEGDPLDLATLTDAQRDRYEQFSVLLDAEQAQRVYEY